MSAVLIPEDLERLVAAGNGMLAWCSDAGAVRRWKREVRRAKGVMTHSPRTKFQGDSAPATGTCFSCFRTAVLSKSGKTWRCLTCGYKERVKP